MERSKPISRATKGKLSTNLIGGELYALGNKNSRDDTKSKIHSIKGSSSLNDRKRESPSTQCVTNKKSKSKIGDEVKSAMDTCDQKIEDNSFYENIATLFSEACFSEKPMEALCTFIEMILQTTTRSKSDGLIYLMLIYVAKIRPDLYTEESISILLATLRRETPQVKNKANCTLAILASNIICHCYCNKLHWPESFIRTYLDDATNERFWVDNEYCSPFTKNICASFGTRLPPQSVFQSEGSTNTLINLHQSSECVEMYALSDKHILDYKLCIRLNYAGIIKCSLKNRYNSCSDKIEKCIVESVKEQLNKRQSQDCYTRNFLKFLCSTSGLIEVRSISISRLELWIHNGKLMKSAQELLAFICFNINSSCIKDQEVLACLVKMRLKTKPLINMYMMCLKEVIVLQSSIAPVILKLVLQNELSNARNPNNMGIIGTMFQAVPEQSARNLAEIYKEFLLQKDDCLRTLRVFLRELVRMLRFEINIVEFCKVFFNGRSEITSQIQKSEFKDRIFHSMVDITCLCMFLTVSPQVRETYIALRSGRDMKNNSILLKFYQQISQIQLDAVSWMYAIVPNMYNTQGQDFSQALQKLLLLESPDQYSRNDQWPSEPERSTLLRIVSETPINEDSLLRIILIGITADIPFTIQETFDVLINVIKRASGLRNSDIPAVHANKFEIIDFLFSMAEYHYPEKIKLPSNYDPPKLAITTLYWKAWTIMLMISAHNPSTFGAFCSDHYPTMKMLMQMCITNQCKDCLSVKDELQASFNKLGATKSGQGAVKTTTPSHFYNMLQFLEPCLRVEAPTTSNLTNISTLEQEQIIEFETHLASQTYPTIINKENSILMSQVMLMDPMGAARRIPANVLESLAQLNKTLKLGHLLCRSRKPDFLLDIIHRQGTSQSLPWLSDLVLNSEGEFRHLPVQCLCEFLLTNVRSLCEDNPRDAKLLNYLRKLLIEENSDKQSVCEMLDYIFRRLSSTVTQARVSAFAGLKLLLNDDENWLLFSLPQIPYFKDVCPFIITQIRSACQVENVPDIVMIYIQFIAAHTQNDPISIMLDHVMDMAQLIVERNTMFHHISYGNSKTKSSTRNVPNDFNYSGYQTLKCLFIMFNNYIIKLREHQEPYEWTQYPDLLMVEFEDGVQLPIHLNIVHAFVILLTHANINIPESIPILDYWFPLAHSTARGYLPEQPNDQIQLLPDWLKLKMIRSPVERLIKAALLELTPDQIVLFVQNFGTPVSSMSKLLALLDHAVIDQFEKVKNAILNRAYLAQLIEIQQGRGAKNGHVTVQALELHCHSQTVPDLYKFKVEKLECIYFSTKISISLNDSSEIQDFKYISSILDNMMKNSSLSESESFKYRNLVHSFLNPYPLTLKSNDEFLSTNLHGIISNFIVAVENYKTSKQFEHILNKKVFTLMRTFFKCKKEQTRPVFNFNNFKKILLNIKTQKYFGKFYKRLLTIFNNEMDSFNSFYNKESSEGLVSNTKMLRETLLETYDLRRKHVDKRLMCFLSQTLSADSSKRGVLVDYVVELDPELSIFSKALEINLMFSKNCKDFRFYLLTLLCHETSWKTLNLTLTYFLGQFRKEYDQSVILNFIDALINNPKICQGRDRSTSKIIKSDIIFFLNKSNIKVLAQYVLSESEFALKNGCFQYYDILYSRIDLLCRVSKKKESIFAGCIDIALRFPCATSLKLRFIHQLYMMHPKIKFLKPDISDILYTKLHHLNGFPSDKVGNHLITCLGNLLSKKDFETIFSDTELLTRKLAASHPILFLRQLGAFCSQIQGKAHISIRTLRDEHHIQRFVLILRTFEVLQPMIFHDDFKCTLQTCFDCYFTYFKYHISEKETYQLVIKFIELLNAYIKTNPSSAFKYIEKYTVILQSLSSKFNFLDTLQQLVQGLILLKHNTIMLSQIKLEKTNQQFDLGLAYNSISGSSFFSKPEGNEVMYDSSMSLHLDIESKIATSLVCSEAQKNSLKISTDIVNLIQIIKRSNIEEIILGPLQEIESLTSKRFSFLHELFDRLLGLIFSPSAQVRSNSYILLIRHLKNQPGNIDIIRSTRNAFIRCLYHHNSAVATTAVDNLVEITVLLQEHSVEILGVAFLLGIKSSTSTGTQIKRSIQTIMLQQGF